MINLLSTAKKALLANQKTIDTIGQNIANINTPGYSRQRVVQQASLPISDALGSYGTGVEVIRLERVRDAALDSQWRDQNSQKSYYESYFDKLNQYESELLEPSDSGLVAHLNKFWDAWSDVSTDPSGSSGYIMRESLLDTTESLCSEFNRLSELVQSKKRQTYTEIKSDINEVNRILSELSALSSSITKANSSNAPNNDLLDQVDLLLDDLSEYGQVKTVYKNDGSLLVYLGSDEVVNKDNARLLKLNDDGTNLSLMFGDNNNTVNGLKSGKINAKLELYNEVLPDMGKELDFLANSMVTEINKLHYKGYDLSDDPETGTPFFSIYTTGAADISLSDQIIGKPEKIALSSKPFEGDNEIALQIANLRERPILENGRLTFNNYYGSVLNQIGTKTQWANDKHEVYKAAETQVNNFRESVKGVSLDEETAELIKFQKAYQAAAKVVNMADQLLSTVISLIK